MNLVSKQDIKNALAETFEKEVGGITMQLDATISNLPDSKIKAMLILSITDYFTRVGHSMENAGGQAYVSSTVNLLCTDLRKSFGHLRIGEIKLAIEYGAKGVLGEIKQCCASTVEGYLSAYLNLNERKLAKDEIAQEKKTLQIEEKAPWSEDEYIRAMRERYRENLNRVYKGYPVKDIGGLLFDHMVKVGILENPTAEDRQEVVDDWYAKLKSNPFDTYTRELVKRHRAGEDVTTLYARQMILQKHIQMDVEARLLKEKSNERHG